jgi:hypothetical protein
VRQAKAKAASKPRRFIGTMELAAKLNCHPMSIPRYCKTKPNFPQPTKPWGKNIWDEDVVDAYIAEVTQPAQKLTGKKKGDHVTATKAYSAS